MGDTRRADEERVEVGVAPAPGESRDAGAGRASTRGPGPRPRRSRRERAASALGASPEQQPAVIAMIESAPLAMRSRVGSMFEGFLVTLLATIPMGLLVGLLFIPLSMGGAAPVVFFSLWSGGLGLVWFLVVRRSLRRERWTQASVRINERACLGCGSGVRGVGGGDDDGGTVRCPECGRATLRRPGASRSELLHARSAIPGGMMPLTEPRATLLTLTHSAADDVDRLTVALAERHPGLGNSALLAGVATFILLGTTAIFVWPMVLDATLSVIASARGAAVSAGVSDILAVSGGAIVLLAVGSASWRVFRIVMNPAWRRVALTAIESNTCFSCGELLRGVMPEAGWCTCPGCGFRSPAVRDGDADESEAADEFEPADEFESGDEDGGPR